MSSILNKAVERDILMSDVVVRAKFPFEAWNIVNSMIKDGDSDLA